MYSIMMHFNIIITCLPYSLTFSGILLLKWKHMGISISPMHATCHVYLRFLTFIIWLTLSAKYKFWAAGLASDHKISLWYWRWKILMYLENVCLNFDLQCLIYKHSHSSAGTYIQWHIYNCILTKQRMVESMYNYKKCIQKFCAFSLWDLWCLQQ
jgi:hypothetical protein